MTSTLKRGVLCVAAVVAAAVTPLVMIWKEGANEPPDRARAETAPHATRDSKSAVADSSSEPASAAAGSTAHHAEMRSTGISPRIRAVLPRLRELPRDWREFNPAAIDITVLPGVTVSFSRARTERDGDAVLWLGTADNPRASVAAIGTPDSWVANVSFAEGNEYLVTVARDGAFISEANPDLEACGNALETFTELPGGAAGAAAVAEADAAVSTSDVLFLYDEATETAVKAELDRNGMSISPAERIDAIVRTLVAQANEDLSRSGIENFRWSVAGAARVPAYDTAGDKSMTADLNAITFADGETGRFSRDRAVEYGADQSVLFVGGARDYAGLAWRPGHHAVCLWGSTHTIVAHEMGHNLDCNHDRETAGAADGGGYNYGHRYASATGRDTGTIMSYAGTRVPYFSNPGVVYQGLPLGVAAGQAKAADNARTIREHAVAMAGYREAVNAPEITRQPTGGTLKVGQTIALSVAAVGGSLSYQWYKDQAAIGGATTATYRRENVTTSDAGSFTVTVTNPRGSVTSAVAVVTIGAPSGIDPPGGAGGTGSSGGGAPSLWFLAALTVLVGLRRLIGSPER